MGARLFKPASAAAVTSTHSENADGRINVNNEADTNSTNGAAATNVTDAVPNANTVRSSDRKRGRAAHAGAGFAMLRLCRMLVFLAAIFSLIFTSRGGPIAITWPQYSAKDDIAPENATWLVSHPERRWTAEALRPISPRN